MVFPIDDIYSSRLPLYFEPLVSLYHIFCLYKSSLLSLYSSIIFSKDLSDPPLIMISSSILLLLVWMIFCGNLDRYVEVILCFRA